jgi:hypothetical protein
MRTSIFPIILYRFYTGATLEPLKPLPRKKYVRIIASAPDLQRAFFQGVTEIPRHGTIIKLLSLHAHKMVLPKPQSLTAVLGSRYQPCGCYRTQIRARSPPWSVLPAEAIANSG